MRRRQVLAGATASFLPFTAGCLGGNNDAVDCPGTENGVPAVIDETDGDDNEDDDGVVFSFTSLDEPPGPLCIEFVVINDQLTRSEVPLVDITVRNLGSESVTWSQTMTDYAFPTRASTEHVLTIGTANEIDRVRIEAEGCIRVAGRTPRDDVLVETTLSPGDSIDGRYAIVGNDNVLAGECPPPGVYRAEHEYGDAGIWGFGFEVES